MSKRNHPPLFAVRLEALKLAAMAGAKLPDETLGIANEYVDWLLKDLPDEDCGCGGKGAAPADEAVKARQALVDMHLEKVLEAKGPSHGFTVSKAAQNLVAELRHNGYNTIGQVALGFGDFSTMARAELKGFFRVCNLMDLLEASGSVEAQASWIQTGTVSVTVQRARDLQD